MGVKILKLVRKNKINTIADFGCGSALILFFLAKNIKNKKFYGFDTAKKIIYMNKLKAKKEKLKNTYFKIDRLPNIKTKQKFDVVICFATLHYISNIKVALENLLEHIKKGGFLIFNYPNQYCYLSYKLKKKKTESEKERFRVVLAKKNLLTIKKIKEITNLKPKIFHKTKGCNPYIILRKI